MVYPLRRYSCPLKKNNKKENSPTKGNKNLHLAFHLDIGSYANLNMAIPAKW